MTRRRYVILLAVAMMAAGASLTGCGSSGSSNSINSTNAAKADVTIAAKFPTADGAVKSLLPAGTVAIEVYSSTLPAVQGQSQTPTLIATLTPAAPTKSIKMGPGQYTISAMAYDSTDATTRKVLGSTSTAGEIVANAANTINLTFLNGQWTLSAPLVLSDGSQLNDFVVSDQRYYGTGKAAFDYSKPIGGGSGGGVKYRFSNNTSARTYGNMLTQFVGTSNSIALFSDAYNLTQKCQDYSGQGLCTPKSGDKLFLLEGTPAGGLPPDSMGSGGYDQGDILYGDAYSLLPNKGQTVFSQPIMTNTAAATSDGKTISGNFIEFALTATPAKAYKTGSSPKIAAAKAVKSQSANTAYSGLVVTDYSYYVCATTATPNKGGWYFYTQPQIIGTATCYDYGNLQPTMINNQPTYNAGDFSYGLVPDTTDLGDYCQVWDYNMYLPYDPATNPNGTALNPNYNTCKQQKPSTGDVYYPYNFKAKKTATKTTISFGSFKFKAWIEETTTGNAYVYPFTATGSTTITPAK